MSEREIGVGVVGLGFMGRTHLAAYRDAARAGSACRVVTLCDAREERFRGTTEQRGNLERESDEPLFDPERVRFTTSFDALLADPEVELVSICTPTDTHVALAAQALGAGKHVLVEKPLALQAEDAERLADLAVRAGRICMPAMCMRFWPGWSWLKEHIDARSFGSVKSAVFRRLGSPPAWSREFYGDADRTGGALFDLHVHDADFVRWCFGAPRAVASTGSLDHVTTLYRYPDGPAHVVAEGGWDHTPGFDFFMGYTVIFEEATAVFALDRTPALSLARGGKCEPIALEDLTGYDGEIRHLLALVRGEVSPAVTVEEGVGLLRMLAAERRSLQTATDVPLT